LFHGSQFLLDTAHHHEHGVQSVRREEGRRRGEERKEGGEGEKREGEGEKREGEGGEEGEEVGSGKGGGGRKEERIGTGRGQSLQICLRIKSLIIYGIHANGNLVSENIIRPATISSSLPLAPFPTIPSSHLHSLLNLLS
jgi:hypothetical protein